MKEIKLKTTTCKDTTEARIIIADTLYKLLLSYDPLNHSAHHHITLHCQDTSIIIKMLVPKETKQSYILYAYCERYDDTILMVGIGVTETPDNQKYKEQISTVVDIIMQSMACVIDVYHLDILTMTIRSNIDEIDNDEWKRIRIGNKSRHDSLNLFLKWVDKNLGITCRQTMIRLHVTLYPHTIDEINSYYDVCIEKGYLFGENVYNIKILYPEMDPDVRVGYKFEELAPEIQENIDNLLQTFERIIINDETCKLEYFYK